MSLIWNDDPGTENRVCACIVILALIYFCTHVFIAWARGSIARATQPQVVEVQK